MLSLREAKRLRGEAEANPEIPRFARNRLRNPNEVATPAFDRLAMTKKQALQSHEFIVRRF